jgi:hypothetical protein
MKINGLSVGEEVAIKPDASRELEFIAPAVIEVIEGARSVTQLGGLINEDVYQTLRKRAIEQAFLRRERGLLAAKFPKVSVTDIHQESTRPDQINSIVLLRIRNRTRAMTIRLEQRVGRWLATAITIL